MSDLVQRATLVLERGYGDEDEEEKTWNVVAYLVHDSGQRDRRTIARRPTREEAAVTLGAIWSEKFGD